MRGSLDGLNNFIFEYDRLVCVGYVGYEFVELLGFLSEEIVLYIRL